MRLLRQLDTRARHVRSAWRCFAPPRLRRSAALHLIRRHTWRAPLRRRRAAVCQAAFLLAIASGAARGGDLEPQLPKLEDLEQHATPATGAPSEPAERMPSTVTICIDRAAGRCWSATRPNGCRERSPDAGVYRVLENQPDGGAGKVLNACWAEIGKR